VQGSGHKRAREACPREKQSRARARQERQERLEKSLEELEKLRTLKAARSPHKRVSIADPEARIMKQPDGGLALSYNAQLSTEASHGLIVGVRVTQAASDWEQLLPALEQIGQRLQQPPKQIVADAGYTTRAFERKVWAPASLPKGFDMSRSAVVSFEGDKIRFFDFRKMPGGYDERIGD
jgi:hypothetical protein